VRVPKKIKNTQGPTTSQPAEAKKGGIDMIAELIGKLAEDEKMALIDKLLANGQDF
jgi:hypothetical protein